MARHCESCKASIGGAAPAHVKYCSGRCRQAAYRRRLGTGVPRELRARPRWVRVTSRKRPITLDGSAASSIDPETWSTYALIRGADRKGFVLNGDGVCCIDFDNCLEGGHPVEWVAEILRRLPPTYVEVSPSGSGLHVFGFAFVPAGRVIRDGRSIEVYGTGRYIQISGRRFAGSPSRLADISAVVSSLL